MPLVFIVFLSFFLVFCFCKKNHIYLKNKIHVERTLNHRFLRHSGGLATHQRSERSRRFPIFHGRVDSTVATDGGCPRGDDQPYDCGLSVLCVM